MFIYCYIVLRTFQRLLQQYFKSVNKEEKIIYFSLDVNFPIILTSPQANSYFGYSAQLHNAQVINLM